MIEIFSFNPMQVNCIILYDETSEAVIIDATFFSEDEKNTFNQFIREKKLKPVKLLNTHGHFDHLTGTTALLQEYNIPFYIHKQDMFLVQNAPAQGRLFGMQTSTIPEPAGFLEDKQLLSFGNTELEISHIPGHSPGSIVFIQKNEKFVISGDVLFAGTIGRTDLPGGDFNTLINGIKSKLMTLDDDFKVYPGHGPATTIGKERYSNPFLN